MDKTVTEFYTKNPEENYIDTYDSQHGGRLDAMIDRFKLKEIKNSKIVDVGGGLGFLGKRLDASNDYYVIDGSLFNEEKKLCKGTWYQSDLDHDKFGFPFYYSLGENSTIYPNKPNLMDYAFFLETIEHISNPFHALIEIKKSVKKDGDIFISFPDETVWHNVVYPGLLWPRQNFEIFLGQMALPIIEFWHWNKGWPAYHYRCRNAGWDEKRMIFPKQEEKFKFANPLECTNL